MTSKQIAEQASKIRTGFGSRRDFTDEPMELVFGADDPIPAEEVCPDCDAPMIDGECENCKAREVEEPSMWAYLDDLSPSERRREEAEIRLERSGMGDRL